MTLSYTTALNFATVMDDTVNQLFILGKIMPVALQSDESSAELVTGEVASVLNTQRATEAKLEEVLSARSDAKGAGLAQDLIGAMAVSARGTEQSMRQNPLGKDSFAKVQSDRQFCEDVMARAQEELLVASDFARLREAVREQRARKIGRQQTIVKEEQGRRKIKLLQRQLIDIRKEKEAELQQRNEMIAHLKDQLQEMKAKSSMEGKYVKKNAENQVQQSQQVCAIGEQRRKEEADRLRHRLDSEARTHVEIENYLKTHQHLLEDKVDLWMEKYDVDVDAKQHELNVLKTSKANDLERLQELTRKYAEYEKVVVEDRIEKEKERRRREQEELELKSAVSMQAWWRGTMVKNQLGPFGKKKGGKKGGKKGKKGGKKKKK